MAGINSAGRDARVVVANRSVQRVFYMFYTILLCVTGPTPSAIPPYCCVRYSSTVADKIDVFRGLKVIPTSSQHSSQRHREREVRERHTLNISEACMRERLKPIMVQLSLPVKVKHLQYIPAFNRQTSMTCVCRQQLLQRYMKPSMQVCFVFFDPASPIQANFALRRWYGTPAMLLLSAIPSRSPNCLATSVYGGGRGESTGCVHWPLSPAEESASSSSESTFRRASDSSQRSSFRLLVQQMTRIGAFWMNRKPAARGRSETIPEMGAGQGIGSRQIKSLGGSAAMVSDNLTTTTQPNGFDIFSPNDFRRARREDPNLAYVCVYMSVSGSVFDSWGKTEVIRWRSCSFVPIIYPCCRGPTLEYACSVFYVFVFSMECAPYIDFDEAFRWTRESRYERAPQVLPALQGRSILFPLACYPWSHRRAIREAEHASRYPCARLHIFCDPLFSCKGGVSLRWRVEIDRASRRCLGRSLLP